MGIRRWWMKKRKLFSQSENSVIAKKRRLNSPGSSRRNNTKKQLLLVSKSEEASARIEQLPDDLLIHVLSFLPNLAEIAKTSILSRRWRYVWHNITCLEFYPDTPMKEKLSTKRKYRYTKRFIEWINSVLDARVAVPGLPLLKELRIWYHLEASMGHPIDRWIDFSIANRVETLDLDFGDHFGIVPSHSQYKLTEEHWYRAPSGLSSLRCLKSLYLSNVDVDKQFVQFLLSSCPLLEYLSLCNAPNLYNLDISGSPPLQLRRLTIGSFTINKLCAPYLTSLYHELPKSNPQKIDVPLLTDLTINACCVPYHQRIMEYLDQFWSHFHQLEKLDLTMQEADKFKLKQVPHFNKLKYLKISINGDTNPICRQIINFMNACPMLETFALEIQDGYEIPRQRRRRNPESHEVDNCLYECLKVLELCWCDRKTIDQEIVGCIINKAPNLEKLNVYPSWRGRRIKEFLKGKAKELCKGRTLEVEITVSRRPSPMS